MLLYPLMMSSSLVLKSMTSSLSNLIGCQGVLIGYHGSSRCHLAGISFIFLPILVQKGQMSSNLPRDRTRFHQLGTCERECFRLAGIAITEGDLRQELIEALAAGKYPTFMQLHLQALVVQALLIQALVVQVLMVQALTSSTK